MGFGEYEDVIGTFLQLVRDADLDEPDGLSFDEVHGEVTFFWSRRKVAVTVELAGFAEAA